ncbi:hypothetical protein PENTCL1PPCAC_15720, partial [Pristionchus entomophagus]
ISSNNVHLRHDHLHLITPSVDYCAWYDARLQESLGIEGKSTILEYSLLVVFFLNDPRQPPRSICPLLYSQCSKCIHHIIIYLRSSHHLHYSFLYGQINKKVFSIDFVLDLRNSPATRARSTLLIPDSLHRQ